MTKSIFNDPDFGTGSSSVLDRPMNSKERSLYKALTSLWTGMVEVDSKLKKGHDEGALIFLTRALNIWGKIEPELSKYSRALHLEESVQSLHLTQGTRLTKEEAIKHIEGMRKVQETLLNKKAIILAKYIGFDSFESTEKKDDIDTACELLGINEDKKEAFIERAIEIAKSLKDGNGIDRFISEEYKKTLKNLYLNPEIEANKFNNKSYNINASELHEKIEREKARLERKRTAAMQSRATVEARIEIAAAASVSTAVFTPLATPKTIPQPKVELPKLFDKINEMLTSEPELLQLSLQAIIDRYPTPNNYFEIANEELGLATAAQLKPILDIHRSYLDPSRAEKYIELTKLLKAINLVSKEQYSPLSRDELLTVLDSINKLMNKGYDPLVPDKGTDIFITDVTYGPRNTIDETVLHAYEERLCQKALFQDTSYDSFIKELAQTSAVQNLGMGELEPRRRIGCKLGLSANDYHIIRAFRALKGEHDSKPVSPEALEAEIRTKHPEFDWENMFSLKTRLKTLEKYFPKLLGLKPTTNHTPSNGLLTRPIKRWTSNIDPLIKLLKLTPDDLAHHNNTNGKYNDLSASLRATVTAAHSAYNSSTIRMTIYYSDSKDPASVTTEPLNRGSFLELIKQIEAKQKEPK